ncbi:MAG: transglycosylase domain-containing protein, partial [Fusobacteriaceae bacterium]
MKKKIIILSAVLLASFFVITFYIYVSTDVKKIKKTFEQRYSVLVLDDKDEIIGVQINKEEQLHLKSTSPIPKKLEITVLTFEDKNFLSHNGIDIKAIFRAFKNNLLMRRTSGASTITMQVAKLYKIKSRNIFNKYLEIIQALKIDKEISKEEILNLYLNNAPYGGNIVGYKTASHLYFQKEPVELTWAEGALLAVLPNSPSLINVEKNRNKLLEKRNRLLKELYERKIIDELQYDLSLQEPLPSKRYSFKNLVPHLTRRFSFEMKDKIIYSTINSELQQKINSAVEEYTFQMNRMGLKNIAALVIDNKNYEVKAYVGSQNFFDEKTNGQVDGIIARRATGSVLKPFLFANSIDAGIIAPESKVIDVPTYFHNFYPKNANDKYYGLIEAENALAKSLNIPFIYMLKDFGDDKFFFFLKRVLKF